MKKTDILLLGLLGLFICIFGPKFDKDMAIRRQAETMREDYLGVMNNSPGPFRFKKGWYYCSTAEASNSVALIIRNNPTLEFGTQTEVEHWGAVQMLKDAGLTNGGPVLVITKK